MQWNPLTKNFLAYLHVCLSQFSILCSCGPSYLFLRVSSMSLSVLHSLILPLSPVSVLSAHLCIYGSSYLSSGHIPSVSTCRLTLFFCSLVDPLHLSLTNCSSRLTLQTDPLSYMQRWTFLILNSWPPKRLDINTLADNRSPGDLKKCDTFFKSLIHFYLTAMFYTRTELVIPTQICLSPYMNTHTYTYAYIYLWSTHN